MHFIIQNQSFAWQPMYVREPVFTILFHIVVMAHNVRESGHNSKVKAQNRCQTEVYSLSSLQNQQIAHLQRRCFVPSKITGGRHGTITFQEQLPFVT